MKQLKQANCRDRDRIAIEQASIYFNLGRVGEFWIVALAGFGKNLYW
jgi:hypothetical protein